MPADSFPLLSPDAAREALLAGRLLLFPTETVYGLGCDATNADAVALVFLLKKRSPAMPLPVVIGSPGQLSQVSYAPTPTARALMEAFWPGPLSLLLPVRRELPDLLTAGTRRIAVRFSPHPAVQRLCALLGGPLVATSANLSGAPSASAPEALDPALGPGVAGLYDEAPAPEGGAPSTLVEVADSGGRGMLRLLRAGAVSAQALKDAGFSLLPPGHKSPIKR